MKQVFASLILIFSILSSHAQSKRDNLIFVDKQGVMRYTKGNTEAAFFGTNYTVPFAYGYRSHKALGVDVEKAIDADVRHMARLGLDAFRVHVWDVEISDSFGNLQQNEHLRLFDYLLSKLKERNIKILITPIAFWGNGYPEPDIKTNGFSYVYTKGGSVVKEEAFKAQENYLKQFFTHVNPYTKLSYRDDPDVIAMEINNEPHHSGPKERTTEYVNRMAAAVRSTGWTKPVFYNISESPAYADAVVKAKVDGHSFQWYPTGLVAGREQKGNLLPNVDVYRIPFLDTIPAFKNRARMVYEFDAGDVMQPVMYPTMARSFRTAGFQWATQFAYDPLYTAYGNTEYQTHYLNLVYTPAKAISLLIASKAFHQLTRGKSYGAYPADTLFGDVRVSYREGLSELNSGEEFYYTGNTSTQPKNVSKLKHIAGVGNSPVVKYEGSGAYFLDKVEDGMWRLEVMPDATMINDPFEKASPKKAVVKLFAKNNLLRLRLNNFRKEFSVLPGVYLLSERGIDKQNDSSNFSSLFEKDLLLSHQPLEQVSADRGFFVQTRLAGIDTVGNVSVEFRNSSNRWKTVPMQPINGIDYNASVPVEVITPGIINYRIIVRKSGGETSTFPGGFKGDPYAWDNYHNESYQITVAAPGSPLELFNPLTDRDKITPYNPDWRSNTIEYITTNSPGRLALKTVASKPSADKLLGWQYVFGDKIKGRSTELPTFTKLVVKARSGTAAKATISLINTDAEAFATTFSLTGQWQELSIPLSSLTPAAQLLLPRPYPGFQSLYFKPSSNRPFSVNNIEKLQMVFAEAGNGSAVDMEVEGIWLQ